MAVELGVPFFEGESIPAGVELVLVCAASGLELREATSVRSRPIVVDFVHGPTGWRRMSGQSRRQPIARAVGLRGPSFRVVDATAGLGRDAFLLACLGCEVAAVERSPVLGLLLADGIRRASGHSAALDRILDRIKPVTADSRDYLLRLPDRERPDVVYLDPMYPESQRSALAKKEMRILRRLVGDDGDAAELLRVARDAALKRVVVKRHREAPPLAEDVSLCFRGRTVRYDVYLRTPASAGSGSSTSKSSSKAAS